MRYWWTVAVLLLLLVVVVSSGMGFVRNLSTPVCEGYQGVLQYDLWPLEDIPYIYGRPANKPCLNRYCAFVCFFLEFKRRQRPIFFYYETWSKGLMYVCIFTIIYLFWSVEFRLFFWCDKFSEGIIEKNVVDPKLLCIIVPVALRCRLVRARFLAGCSDYYCFQHALVSSFVYYWCLLSGVGVGFMSLYDASCGLRFFCLFTL